MSQITWDVFISHASEDKEEVAIPLAQLLMAEGFKVWLDKTELFVGDSLREKIDEGLTRSQFGIVILTHDFFSKGWPKSELDGLFSREIGGEKVILPVWHNIDLEEIREYSPLIAGRIAANTKTGLKEVKEQILSAITKVGRKESIAKAIYSGKLSKKSIFQFPEGSILVSNCYSSYDQRPIIEEIVGTIEERDLLWEKVKSRGADSRLCSVFKEEDDYIAHMRRLNSLMQRKEV
ncbi:hypothetical protein TUM4261_41270 [Shewanella sp. c952]|uniref:toll/interleukin-1 receptor domain-containing protein n=1 Tax=Shewanella sp. c952 TaxID=2815913 RepID=UPI001BC1EEB2|nr:toll/interleukin-1 receptor domain-containing protein [Shewanella sp. c952]GIU19376.1 hypothetical protein TUM4261_41270 [Shewanella sp. c952]